MGQVRGGRLRHKPAFTLESVHYITGRGLVLSGIALEESEIGDEVLLRASIKGIETFNGHKEPGSKVGLLLEGWEIV